MKSSPTNATPPSRTADGCREGRGARRAPRTPPPPKSRERTGTPYISRVAVRERAASKRQGEGSEDVSGGQTGVDRAAMDVALELGRVRRWCRRGWRRWATDARYPLRETPSATGGAHGVERRNSNATLILPAAAPGPELTIETPPAGRPSTPPRARGRVGMFRRGCRSTRPHLTGGRARARRGHLRRGSGSWRRVVAPTTTLRSRL